MNKREFIKKTCLATLGVSLAPHLLANSFSKKKPNLLFIFPDQYRQASLGFLNQDPVKTPNIDKIAKNGMFFNNAVSNYPLCSPFRAMLLTGKYPLSNGVISNCNSGRTDLGVFLKKEEKCFSDVLSDSNYSVGYVGKWHLDGPKATKKGEEKVWDSYCEMDKRHGFDYWYSYGTDNNHNNPHYWINNSKKDEQKYFKEWSPIHEAEILSNYIEITNKQRDKNKPFALFWGINPPHTPFNQVPDKFKQRFKNKSAKDVLFRDNVSFVQNNEFKENGFGNTNINSVNQATDYFAMVEGIDEQIGKVVKVLKDKGIYDDTIIVFCSDHGEMLGSQGLMHKNIWFKESMNIPFLISYPNGIKKNTKNDLLLSVPDIMPTLLGLMGLKNRIPDTVQGKDYSRIFKNTLVDKPKSALYYFIKPENLKIQRRGIKTLKYTFVLAFNNKEKLMGYLYDDVNDIYQKKNIYNENSPLTKEAKGLLILSLKEQNDSFWKRIS